MLGSLNSDILSVLGEEKSLLLAADMYPESILDIVLGMSVDDRNVEDDEVITGVVVKEFLVDDVGIELFELLSVLHFLSLDSICFLLALILFLKQINTESFSDRILECYINI